ncbi:MAG: signal recognition particle subunit SRP19/SEC65 family protein [Candidatus Bathyarchaeia archaeon]
MRKQDKVIIWPAYFDVVRSREDGRRVPKSIAVVSPKIAEVKEAAEKLSLTCEVFPEAGYPKTSWLKTGMVLVEKKGSKNQTITMIAKQLSNMRSVAKVE